MAVEAVEGGGQAGGEAPRGLWRAIGPGILFAGAAVGVSHLVQSTRAGAGYGFALLGLVLVVGYVIYLRATLRSIGTAGMVLVAALVGSLLWVLYDWGVLSLSNSALNVWMGLLALSLVLGIGLSWSHVRRALSGQIDDTGGE